MRERQRVCSLVVGMLLLALPAVVPLAPAEDNARGLTAAEETAILAGETFTVQGESTIEIQSHAGQPRQLHLGRDVQLSAPFSFGAYGKNPSGVLCVEPNNVRICFTWYNSFTESSSQVNRLSGRSWALAVAGSTSLLLDLPQGTTEEVLMAALDLAAQVLLTNQGAAWSAVGEAYEMAPRCTGQVGSLPADVRFQYEYRGAIDAAPFGVAWSLGSLVSKAMPWAQGHDLSANEKAVDVRSHAQEGLFFDRFKYLDTGFNTTRPFRETIRTGPGISYMSTITLARAESTLLGTAKAVADVWSGGRVLQVNSIDIDFHDTGGPPTTTASPVGGVAGNNGWYRSDVDVRVTGSDPETCVNSVETGVNGGARTERVVDPNSPSVDVRVSGDGRHTVQHRAQNWQWSWGTQRSSSVNIDRVAPSTSANAAGTQGNAGWWLSPVTVGFGCADATSGCSGTLWSVNGGSWQGGSQATVAGDGSHGLRFYSEDVAGNREAERSGSYRIDATPPTTTQAHTGPGGLNGWFRGPVTMTLACSDATSGCASTHTRVGSAEQAGSSRVISADGAHDVAYWSNDAAGNRESARSVQVKVDQTPPITSAALSGTRGKDGWYTSAVRVALTCTDPASGCAVTQFRVDGGSWQPGSSVTVTKDGTHVVRFRSQDAAGNEEAERSVSLKLDRTPPTVELTRPLEGHCYAQDVQLRAVGTTTCATGTHMTLAAEASDATSRMDFVEFWVDEDVLEQVPQEPWEARWNLLSPPVPGYREVHACAEDRAGNRACLEPMRVLVAG